MNLHLDEAWRALRLADRDIRAFEVLREDGETHASIVCFHAQQAVEKCLKAVLYSRRIEFRRTHHLPELALLLVQDGVEVPLTQEQLMWLSPFAVTFRYDDADVELNAADELAVWVRVVREWAGAQIDAAAGP